MVGPGRNGFSLGLPSWGDEIKEILLPYALLDLLALTVEDLAEGCKDISVGA